MKKSTTLAGLLLAFFVGMFIAPTQSLAAPNDGKIVFTTEYKNPLTPATTTLIRARPISVAYGLESLTPAETGFQRVFFYPDTDANARETWQYLFGSMDGYTFDKAQTVSGVYKIADLNAGMKPCGCDMPEARAKWYGSNCPEPGENYGGSCCLPECG